ncbi:HEPN domain-containing protein [Rhodopseudomonas palustris]|uniref:HEPN domain-containing protein n=1 Tax=Rhodopseudomonas palustris (strain BisB18) TaxID=316056 RepID=Q20WR2_RHOPB
MSSNDPISWLELAKCDATAARRLLLPPASVQQAAYFVQQAAEKAAKARLIDRGIAFPRHGGRGHDLVALAELLPGDDALKAAFAEISVITPWATAFRYPSDDPATEPQLTVQEITQRLQQVEDTIDALAGIFGDHTGS